MSLIGNILWIIFGGLFSGLSWILSGIIWCITIVGIPYGLQCFKFASMSFAPFGKEIEYGGGVPSLFANIIWIIFFGIPMAIENFIFGSFVINIPYTGMQVTKPILNFTVSGTWRFHINIQLIIILSSLSFDISNHFPIVAYI